MTDVLIIVEGATEEAFANDVLLPHLIARGGRPVPVLTGTRKSRRAEKGGHRNTYDAIQDDILRILKEHGPRGARVSTMLDLYGLPNDFPGYVTSRGVPDPYTRVAGIEAAMAASIADYRFLPYIQLHELEALLLSEPGKAAHLYPGHEEALQVLAREVAQFPGPEWVNDNPLTAPSKRLERCVPGYDKRYAAPLIAQDIGLDVIRERCPHFGEWLSKLEALAQDAGG